MKQDENEKANTNLKEGGSITIPAAKTLTLILRLHRKLRRNDEINKEMKKKNKIK